MLKFQFNIVSFLFKVIPIILFCIYSYDITSQYLQYQTITNFERIIESGSLPPLWYIVCIYTTDYDRSAEAYPNFTSSLVFKKINITRNKRNIQLFGEPFQYEYGTFTCQEIQFERLPYVETEIFVFQTNVPFVVFLGNDLMVRARNGSIAMLRNFMNGLYRFSLEKTIVKSLEAPFDTDCRYRPDTPRDCYISCRSRSANNFYEAKVCSDKCKQRKCIDIFFEDKIVLSYSSSLSLVFGPHIAFLEAVAKFSLTLFIQQLIGLFTMLFDFTIKYLSKQIMVIMKNFTSILRKKNRKKLNIWASKVIAFSVFIGCFGHCYFSITKYMEYATTSETFMGKTAKTSFPTVRFCTVNPSESTKHTFETHSLENYGLHEITIHGTSNNASYRCYIFSPNLMETEMDIGDYEFKIVLEYIEYDISIYYEKSSCHPITKIAMIPNQTLYFGNQLRSYKRLASPYTSHCLDHPEWCLIEPKRNSNHFSGDNRPKYQTKLQCNEVQMYVTRAITTPMEGRSAIAIFNHDKVLLNALSANQSFVEFSIYLASMLSLWLGFSILYLSSRANLHLHKFITAIPLQSHFILLIFGLSMDLTYIFECYFNYEIISVVSLDSQKPFKLPCITFYFNYDSATSRNEFNSTIDPRILSPREVRDLFSKNITYFDDIFFKNSSTYDMQPLVPHDIHKYIGGYVLQNAFAITIEFSTIDSLKYDWVLLRDPGPLVDINFNRSKIKPRYLESLSSSIPFMTIHQNPYFVPTYKNLINVARNQTVKTRIHNSKLLKFPYSSQCIDYMDMLSTPNSFYGCMTNRHITKYNKLPSDLSLPISMNHSRIPTDPEILKLCHKMHNTRPFCTTTDYQPFFEQMNGKYVDFRLGTPLEQTSCEFSAKMSFEELTILVLDTIGLWLGISLILLLKKFKNLCCAPGKKLPEFLVDISDKK